MESLTELIAATGRPRDELARMLGYASRTSLRQAEKGRQRLPEEKMRWLIAYTTFLAKLNTRHAEWLEKNPPPGGENG